MGSKLQSNTIIKGYINSYCLICECYFDTDEDATAHIEDEAHIARLSRHPYLEKYGDNHIRKVVKGYYCEFCGLLLATTAKVAIHIQEKAHFDKKGTFLLRRPSGQSAVLAFDDLLIDERAWHSLTEDTCAICNEEFANEKIHKTETAHLLKLVQTKVEFAAGNNLYRKTDESSFQCLTCNSVFVLNSLNDHFTNRDHKNLYSKCQEEYKKYMELNKSKSVENPIKTTKEINDKNREAKSIKNDVGIQQNTEMKAQDNEAIRIDARAQETNTQTKKEVTTKDQKTTHDKNHNNIDVKTQAKTSDYDAQNMVVARIDTKAEKVEADTEKSEPADEATVYANANNLTYNPSNTNAFCRICETKLPAPLRSMKEHVNGKEHKNKLAKLKQNSAPNCKRQQIKKKPMSKYVDYCVNVVIMFQECAVINEKLCISVESFVMMTPIGRGRYRCQVCEVNVDDDNIAEHAATDRHERYMQNTPVITSLPETEFVREVRPNIFHCGYCNLIIPRWDDVNKHLQSREHRDNKGRCVYRLQLVLPEAIRIRRREENEMLAARRWAMERMKLGF